MNETTLQVRPEAMAQYLMYRYQIQPGQCLCVALGQPATPDNTAALVAWVRGALDIYHDAPLDLQIELIEQDLCRLMVDAGLVEDPAQSCPIPASLIAGVFGRRPARTPVRQMQAGRRRDRGADNIVPFPGGDHE